ncbi:MAG: hypothetical protein AAGG48_04595 [Planctomycetota bacterium]
MLRFFAEGDDFERAGVFDLEAVGAFELEVDFDVGEVFAAGDDFGAEDLEPLPLDFRLRRRCTFLISSINSAFFIPCQPATP